MFAYTRLVIVVFSYCVFQFLVTWELIKISNFLNGLFYQSMEYITRLIVAQVPAIIRRKSPVGQL